MCLLCHSHVLRRFPTRLGLQCGGKQAVLSSRSKLAAEMQDPDVQGFTPLRRSASLGAELHSLRPLECSMDEDAQRPARKQAPAKQYIPSSDPISVRRAHHLLASSSIQPAT